MKSGVGESDRRWDGLEDLVGRHNLGSLAAKQEKHGRIVDVFKNNPR